ncbi:ClC family H(+)/Cl(-) exchange transporter [Clostridium sp. Mt-5]|uniref:ClC family H(+)/Cl(-) exchange transporter n=1 Tax=Clostridium moutaii TaxID=3240932 RepID=A0ABV4BNN3_9CLOT
MKSNTVNTIEVWYNFKIKIILKSMLVGIFAGFITVFYRYLLEKSLIAAHFIYSMELKNFWLIPVFTVVLITAGYVVGCIVQSDSMVAGSGIPQVEGILIGKLRMNWYKVILKKFMAGVIAIGAGLSLGREGPSIQIGAAVGQGIGRLFKGTDLEEKFLITSGASAGLAAAFNAPLAGCIFALEEIHKNFSSKILISAFSASIISDFIAKQLLGMSPVFNFNYIKVMPLKNYSYIVLFGIILALCGVLFNKALLKSQDIYNSKKWLTVKRKPIIAFLIAGVMGLVLPQVLGGGHDLVSALANSNMTIQMMIVILVGKFLFTMSSYGSGTPGGIFLPLLVIGALIGSIYGNIIHVAFGFNSQYINNLIILGMAGYFSSVVKSPITGIVLITEMTGAFTNLLSVSVVSIVAYIFSDMLNSKPVYELLLGRILNKNTGCKIEDNKKTIVETVVHINSDICGKKIKNVTFPPHCLIVALKRGEKEIIPKGDTVIWAGDYLIILIDKSYEAEVRKSLYELD